MKKELSITEISRRMNKAFAPDITFRQLTKSEWLMVPDTELGSTWLKIRIGIRMDKGKLLPNALFEEVYNNALNCQLTVGSEPLNE